MAGPQSPEQRVLLLRDVQRFFQKHNSAAASRRFVRSPEQKELAFLSRNSLGGKSWQALSFARANAWSIVAKASTDRPHWRVLQRLCPEGSG